MTEFAPPEPPPVPVRLSPLTPGERAPSFRLPAVDSDGNASQVDLDEEVLRGLVLLVFYQDDGMPVCTRELAAFAQEHATLASAGVRVFGINTNGLGSHRKFQERDGFPFPLISDFFAEAVKPYGLWDPDEAKSRRALVLIGHNRVVRYVEPHFNPGNLNAFEKVFEVLGLLEAPADDTG